MTIEEIINLGEDSLVEFKSEKFNNDSLAKEIVAFSNLQGGSIYIGIEDDCTVSGVSIKGIEEKIVNICRNNVVPSIIPQITVHNILGKKVLKIVLEPGKVKPYKVRSSNKYYIRAGSVSIEPTNEELLRLFQNGEQFHFEVSPLISTSVKNIDSVSFKHYCENYRGIEPDAGDIEKLLYNWQLIDENKVSTVVGLLFFGKKIQKYLPQSGIDLIFYNGKDITADIIDFKAIEGGIPELVEAAISFVKLNSRVRAEFNSDQTIRTEKYDFDPFAVRELIANAFMHRDWSIFGQKIKMTLFEDRLETFSPGGFPNTLNLTRALNGISYYRNPIISQLLKDYGYSDKAGRGLQKIVKFYDMREGKKPKFEVDVNYIKVTLYK
jgi:ATP-dependent DNA helicase RecG